MMDFDCDVPACIARWKEMDVEDMLDFHWFGIVTVIKSDAKLKIKGGIQVNGFNTSILYRLTCLLPNLNEGQTFRLESSGVFEASVVAIPIKDPGKYKVFLLAVNLSHEYDRRDFVIARFIADMTYQNILLREQVIREKNYLENVLNSSDISIISLDLNGVITTANPASQNVLNLPYQEIIGQKISQYIKDCGDYVNKVEQVFKSNTAIVGREIKFETARGSKVLNAAFSPLNDGYGNVIGVVVLASDVTNKKIFELGIEQIKQFAQLGELAAGIAHDIKNPLMSIKGCARLLEEDLKPLMLQQDFLGPIIKEVDRINEVTEHMLNFARLSEGEVFRDVNINEILNKSISFIRFQRNAKQITFNIDFQSGLSNIKGNIIQLQQAFINILLNAVQAIEDKGTITVKTLISPDQATIVVTISDNGVGISAEHFDKIFQPFYSTKKNGTGLGLVIAQNAIHKHGGEISFFSEKKKGTTCQVLLPYKGVV